VSRPNTRRRDVQRVEHLLAQELGVIFPVHVPGLIMPDSETLTIGAIAWSTSFADCNGSWRGSEPAFRVSDSHESIAVASRPTKNSALLRVEEFRVELVDASQHGSIIGFPTTELKLLARLPRLFFLPPAFLTPVSRSIADFRQQTGRTQNGQVRGWPVYSEARSAASTSM